MPSLPTPSQVELIAALPDPVIRNLQITQCYHELALAMTERTGLEANWCTFATWASKQAGQTIRKEDLARSLGMVAEDETRLKAAGKLVTAARRVGIRLKSEKLLTLTWKAVDPQAALSHSSAAVARGNLKVFAEIGFEFARFYALCLPDSSYNQEKINSFLLGLRTGDPPDGQEYLRKAFQRYYRAFFETDAKVCSELLLLANLEIGYHEQTRLQPEITEALEAPVITPHTFTRNLLRAYFPQAGWLAEAMGLLLHRAGDLVGFDVAAEGIVTAARRDAQALVTRTMMTLQLPPDQRLRLGEDLRSGYPPRLQQLANSELRALLAQIDPTPDSLSSSGAKVWGDLADRLHFIADLFRCYQCAQELFAPPFSADQTTALKDGRLPAGRL